MSDIVRCDGCQKEATKPTAGWLLVDWFGVDVSHYGSRPMPRHYCSPKCLREDFSEECVTCGRDIGKGCGYCACADAQEVDR